MLFATIMTQVEMVDDEMVDEMVDWLMGDDDRFYFNFTILSHNQPFYHLISSI